MLLRILIKEKEDMESKALNFIKRVITTLILLPAVLYINHIGGIIFDLFLLIILVFSIIEVVNIVNKAKQMSIYQKLLWIILVSIYICCSLLSLKYIRSRPFGNIYIILLLSWIWIFDSAAYIVGSLVKGPKLCPVISPKKTWSGLIGGICATSLVSFLEAKLLLPHPSLVEAECVRLGIIIPHFLSINVIMNMCYVTWILIGVFIGLVGQVGDILESYFKRKFGVKDSGNILPGHGGILDRLDSVFLGAIFFYIIIYFCV